MSTHSSTGSSAPRNSSPSRPVKETRCPASKTSTARSSSTITARRGTAASCRYRPRTRPRASTRSAATKWCSTSTSTATPCTDLKIAGQGCSISQASTSMMSAAVKGLPVADARKLIRAFKALMSIHESKLEGEADGEDLRADLEGRAPGRPRGAPGRREVPGADQVRHVGLEHAAAGSRRDRERRRSEK